MWTLTWRTRMSLYSRFLAIALAMTMTALLAGRGTALADCAIDDPIGDVFWSHDGRVTAVVPAYRDIALAQLTSLEGGVLELSMTVAGAIPAAPELEPSIQEIQWGFRIDSDPSTAPPGYPSSPAQAEPPEYVVRLLWNGESFRGELIDRRPLSSGGDAVITSIPFAIDGSTVTLWVDAEAIEATAFLLRGNSVDRLSDGQGNRAVSPLDRTEQSQCTVE
jgi:hypothetical protein